MNKLRTLLAGLALAVASVGALALQPGSASATVLEVGAYQYCFGNQLDVTFSWLSNTPQATTYIDLSQLDNGWQQGTYVTAGPFGAGTVSYKWRGIEPGRWHVVRLNQQADSGAWQPSSTFSFFANGCGAEAAVVIAPPITQLVATVNLVKCNDGTKSDIDGSFTCAHHGGISSKVTQPQVYTPYAGLYGNDVPVGTTGPYIPYAGAPGTVTTAQPTLLLCANGTIQTSCASAGGAANTVASSTTNGSNGPALGPS
jgi:hypothetical protein